MVTRNTSTGGFLVGSLLLDTIGGSLILYGSQQKLAESLDTYGDDSAGTGIIVFGGLLFIIGIVMLCIVLSRVGDLIDTLQWNASMKEQEIVRSSAPKPSNAMVRVQELQRNSRPRETSDSSAPKPSNATPNAPESSGRHTHDKPSDLPARE